MTDLEELEGLHDEVAKVESLLLSVVDVVAHVGVLSDEDVEHRNININRYIYMYIYIYTYPAVVIRLVQNWSGSK